MSYHTLTSKELHECIAAKTELGAVNWRLKEAKSDLAKLKKRYDKSVDELRIFDDANNCLRNELKEQDSYWQRRLREAHRMCELKTASLKRHIEKLTELSVRDLMIRAFPPIILKSGNDKELHDLQEELSRQLEINRLLTITNENLKTRMQCVEKIIVESV